MKLDVYETGISDHHKMIFSVLRKLNFYCCYKKYDKNSFNKALQNKISQPDVSFAEILEIFQLTLDAFAPYKRTKIRCYNNPFMTESFRKINVQKL